MNYLWGNKPYYKSLFKEVSTKFFSFCDKGNLKFYHGEEPIEIFLENIKASETIYNSYEKHLTIIKSVAPYETYVVELNNLQIMDKLYPKKEGTIDLKGIW